MAAIWFAGRFVLSSSSVDGTFGWNLWTGSLGGLGTSQVLPPTSGRLDQSTPAGLAEAIGHAHALDQDTVATLGVSSVTIGNAQAGSGSEYQNIASNPAYYYPSPSTGDLNTICQQIASSFACR